MYEKSDGTRVNKARRPQTSPLATKVLIEYVPYHEPKGKSRYRVGTGGGGRMAPRKGNVSNREG